MNTTLLFLPGASGNTAFWEPVASRLAFSDKKWPPTLRCPQRRRFLSWGGPAIKKIHLDWPGFGPTPAHPDINSFDDLVKRVIDRINSPTVLIAQSMGGVIAMLAALAKPQWVTHLVLTATSGGLDMARFDADDWRPDFSDEYPFVPDWFARCQHDLTPRLAELIMPTLLVWGDSDPISPVAVGRELALRLPNAVLHLVPGGKHDVANAFAEDVAQRIKAFLNRN